MTEPGQGPTTLHLIVPSPTGDGVLVQLPGDDRRAHLPERQLPSSGNNDEDEPLMEPILASIAELLGPDVPVLRIAPIDLSRHHHADHIVVETEAAPDPAAATGLTWQPIAGFDCATLADQAIRAPVQRWLDEHRRGRPNEKRPVWSRPGFLDRARSWMASQLEASGTPPLAPPRLTQLWGISAFLEGQTASGTVFFKSCAAVFPTEPAITLAIDRALPGVGPPVVAIEPEQRWLLMRDAGGSALGKEPVERWSIGLAEFGRVQRAWAEAASRLPTGLQVELEDRTPRRLAAILPALFEDPVLDELASADRARLHLELPRLIDACHRIADLGLSKTLVHGDFHPWNVHVDGDRVVIIDWSDTAIGHPFFDLPTFVGRTRDIARRRAMVDAYLAGWADEVDRAALEEAAHLGLVLGSLHQVESYRRIMETLEPDDRWDLGQGAPAHARRALAWLDMGLEATDSD